VTRPFHSWAFSLAGKPLKEAATLLALEIAFELPNDFDIDC